MTELSPAIREALQRRLGLAEVDLEILGAVLAAELGGGRAVAVADLFARAGGRREDAARTIERLQPDRPLCTRALVTVRGDGPLAERTLQLEPAFWPHLVGVVPGDGSIPSPRGARVATLALAPDVRMRAREAAAWLRGRTTAALVIVGPPGSGRGGLAEAIVADSGSPAIACEPDVLAARGPRALARDAAWHEAALIVTDATTRDAAALFELGTLASGPLVITTELGGLAASLMRSGRDVHTLAIDALDAAAREALWRRRLGAEAKLDLSRIAHRFGYGPAAIAVVAELAAARAAAAGRVEPVEADLVETCRTVTDVDLAGLAERLPTTFCREDLVVARATRREIALIETWLACGPALFAGHAAATTRSPGMTALFHGPPGTGKTLAAQVIAATAGYDLFRVDLAGVVDKYIGETEKRLDRLFTLAAAAGAILFFDEADALFGKRTEISDARDRYANLGTSYLLQRLEQHRGLSILASNAHQNFDAAFMRRFQVIAEFAMPGVAERRAIWQRHLPVASQGAIDLDFVASHLQLAGGDIRNAVFAAVLMAAGEGVALGMPHVLTAVWRELRKAGRLIEASTLGPWQAAVLDRVAIDRRT